MNVEMTAVTHVAADTIRISHRDVRTVTINVTHREASWRTDFSMVVKSAPGCGIGLAVAGGRAQPLKNADVDALIEALQAAKAHADVVAGAPQVPLES